MEGDLDAFQGIDVVVVLAQVPIHGSVLLMDHSASKVERSVANLAPTLIMVANVFVNRDIMREVTGAA